MKPSLGIRMLSYLLGTLSLRKIALSLLFCAVLLGWVLTPSAEIYRWQDRDGVIRYSNTPPDDESLILEKVPTQRIPLIEDTNGTVYYLHVPEGASPAITPDQTAREPLTLPPEVVNQLLQEASQPPPAMMAASAPDLTALTMRLTELEQSLQRELVNRRQWEQDYHHAQAYAEKLEQQNQTLKLAMAQVETKLAAFEQQWQQKTQHTQAYTKKLEQQNGILQLALSEMQTRVERLQRTMADSTQVNDLKARQQNALETLYARLENVETDMQAWQGQAATGKTVTSLSQKLAELEARLPQLSTEVKTTYEQNLETFSQKFARLESKLDSLDVVDQISALSSKVETLETQHTPVTQDVQAKLATLEASLDTIQDMIPSSQRAAEIVEKLLNNGEILKNVISNQSQQLDAQTARIQHLEQELARLKTLRTAMPEQDTSVLSAASVSQTVASDPDLTKLLERQQLMESLITRQSTTLTMQKDRIEALETALEQSGHIDIVTEENPSGRILIVPRKERRTEPKISLLEVLRTSF